MPIIKIMSSRNPQDQKQKIENKLSKIIARDKRKKNPAFQYVKSDLPSRIAKKTIVEKPKVFEIGIAGISASGKTTISNKITDTLKTFQKKFSENLLSVADADKYITDKSELIKQYGNFDNFIKNSGVSLNVPESYYLDLQAADLIKLKSGESIKMPQYLFNGTGISKPESIPLKPGKIILSEGLFNLTEKFKDIFDLKIFIDAPMSVIKDRWYKREGSRGNNDINTMNALFNDVEKQSVKHIIPTKENADIVMNGTAKLNYVKHLTKKIFRIINH